MEKDLINIKFVVNSNSQLRLNLEIKALNVTRMIDIYHLAIERVNPSITDTGFKKTKMVMTMILEGWIRKLNNLLEDGIDFLPIDFQDEYIGCLKVHKTNPSTIIVQYGFTEKLSAVHISPTDVHNFIILYEDFQPDSHRTHLIEETNLKASIETLIQRLGGDED